MGSYTSLTIDNCTILTTGSYAYSEVLTVFRESDKYIRSVPRKDQPEPVHDPEDLFELDEKIEIGYQAPGWIIRDRLEVMGFTLAATRSVFEKGIAARIERLQLEQIYDTATASLWQSDITMLNQLTFDGWLSSFHKLKVFSVTLLSAGEQDSADGDSESEQDPLEPLDQFILGENGMYPFQFPLVDIRFFLRAVVEACGDEVVLCQVLDDVVNAGYYAFDDDIAENAMADLEEDFPINAPIVVLTEGVTDIRFLKGALAVLYPHLVDYFGFMDFEGAAVAGGAGPLVATVKAFAGAGIANRVIALFDNDTAARVAVRGLRQIELPPSIKILHYPPLPIAENYPTLGPSGPATMNVNGLAASIELYFGKDVLLGADGKLTPVVWRNYENAVNSYQGEVSNKALLQHKFEEKLEAAANDESLLKTLDWSGMRLILEELIGAFTNEPSKIADD